MRRLLTVLAAAALGAALASSAGAAQRQLSIIHLQKGCHTWASGKQLPPATSLSLHRGDRLTIVDQDIDAHQLVQTAGPRVRVGGPVMMGHRRQLTFAKAGIYKFKTRVVEMKGMPEVKTTGPDHNLFLTVKVS